MNITYSYTYNTWNIVAAVYKENCLVEKADYVERIGLFCCDNYINDLFK